MLIRFLGREEVLPLVGECPIDYSIPWVDIGRSWKGKKSLNSSLPGLITASIRGTLFIGDKESFNAVCQWPIQPGDRAGGK